MHKFDMPGDYVALVTKRQGRAHTMDAIDGPTTALVVVDMQHYFMSPPYPSACPVAQAIVPNVNRLAAAMRQAGGLVVWIQNHTPWQSLTSWRTHQERSLEPRRMGRMEAMQKGAHGFQLWPGLDVQPEDARVLKRRFSAFIQGSSDIENVLKDHGIRSILVTGVATNVCCESTARDAMMLNYRTLMVSDGCAAATDTEHGTTLRSFYLYFGDVQITDEIIARLSASGRRNAPPAQAGRVTGPN
jgi:ureidoacrylate peracid hydrolase